jgi:hypothetical protein
MLKLSVTCEWCLTTRSGNSIRNIQLVWPVAPAISAPYAPTREHIMVLRELVKVRVAQMRTRTTQRKLGTLQVSAYRGTRYWILCVS